MWGLKQSSLGAPAEPSVTISLPNETPSFVRVTAPVGWDDLQGQLGLFFLLKNTVKSPPHFLNNTLLFSLIFFLLLGGA